MTIPDHLRLLGELGKMTVENLKAFVSVQYRWMTDREYRKESRLWTHHRAQTTYYPVVVINTRKR